ncbi:Ribokinase [Mycena sanguinolenta]|uniref:Ribokinase n=1 Tax=Mycena sanguinolenta TaxID=230812 RepID=A0A8H6ZGT4_9AGAR|nr:Ribokinase [Mycena sanguinolenta]
MPARCLVRGSINVDEFFQGLRGPVQRFTDLVIIVKEIARPGETISAENLVKRPGGKGANQAGALARAGVAVDFVGAIGQDGLWVRDELKETGVDVESMSVVEENTGRAIIQVNEIGENSIILYKGANYVSIPSHTIHPDTTHAVFQNEIPLSSTIEYLTQASSSQISTIFNPSPMPTPEELKTFPWHQLTWLVVNSGEALALCKALGLEVPDPSTSASAVDVAKPLLSRLSSGMPTTNVVCTLGADGVLAQFTLFNSKSEPVYLPAAKLQGTTRDTTGAGDCFTGYMVAGLMRLEGKEVTTADYVAVLKRAVQAAGMCVEKRGALASIPLAREVEARLNSAS